MLGVIEARKGFFNPPHRHMNAPLTYLKHVREEFTHIVWPTRQRAIAHALVVIFIALVIALFVGLLDYLFSIVVSGIAG